MMDFNSTQMEAPQKRFSEWLRIGFQVFFLRIKTFIFVFIGTVITTMCLSFILPSLYVGHLSILVKSNEADVTGLLPNSNVSVKGGIVKESLTMNEQNILVSSTLAKRVVDQMKNQHGDDIVFGWLAKLIPEWITNMFTPFGNLVSKVMSAVGLSGKGGFSPDPLIEDFKGSLNVEPVVGSHVINVSLMHFNPLFLESLLQVYLDEYLKLRDSIWIKDDAPHFFRDLADSYWKEWSDINKNRLDMEEELSNLIPSHQSNNVASQINKIEVKILDFNYEEQKNRNYLEHVKGIDLSKIESYQVLTNNVVLQDMYTKISRLEIEKTDSLKLFTENAPMIQRIDRELLMLRKKYKDFILEYYKNNIKLIQKEKKMLIDIQEELRQKALKIDQTLFGISKLKQKSDIVKSHVHSYEKKFHETKIANTLKKNMRTSVGISSYPYVGPKVFPKKKIMLFVSIGLGFFMGFLVIAVKELLDDSYKFPEEIHHDLGLNVLASLPDSNDK